MKKVFTIFVVLMLSSIGLMAQTVFTLGTGTIVNGTSGWPTSYGQYYSGNRVQYLILASELASLGVGPGTLSAIAFDVVTPAPPTSSGSAPDGSNLRNYTINIGTTTVSDITGFLPVPATVYSVLQFITTVGWNVHTFTTPYVWDGMSNLVIETCFDNYLTASNYSTSAVVNQTATPFTSLVHYYSDAGGVCLNTTVSGTFSQRPNMQLTFTATNANDAGVTAITSPVAPVAPGIHAVQAKVTNFGTAALTSATIGWSVNGVVQTPVNWTGNLASTLTSENIAVGSFNFPAGLNTIKVWTSSPNGVTDGFAFNDTSTVIINFSAPLSGTYTIGGAGADYATIGAALADMTSAGIGGPVIFNVTANSGPYIGGIDFGTYPGISATNTVTFNGNGNVINEGTPAYFMAFNGSSYITINNFQLINTVPATAKFGIMVRGASQYLSFTNNFIDVGTVATGSAQSCIAVSGSITSAVTAGNNGQYITITGNELVGGYYALTLMGNSSYLDNYGHLVANNIVRDFYLYGIYLANAENTTVINNEVHRANRAGLSTLYGIYLNTSRNIKVLKNKVHTTGAGTYSAYPIYVTGSVNSLGLETEFINNAIYNIPTSGTVYGIYFLGTRDYINVFHNTVHLDVQLAGTKYAFYASTAPNNHVLKNNIFSVQGPGTGSKYCIYIGATSTSFTSDYNDFYMGGTGGTVNNVGYWSAARNSLLDWQTATNQDMNSFNVNPAFFAVNDFRTSSLDLYQMGTPITTVTDDILGNPRNPVSPCIGAFEYILYMRDAGITMMTEPAAVCAGLSPVKVKIKNWGIQSFTGATVNWSVNGVAQTPFAYTNALTPGSEEEVTIGSYNFLANTPYTLVFSTSNPGGQPDQNPANDTLIVTGFQTSLNGIYTIGQGASDNFASIADAVAALQAFGVCGPVTFNVAANSGPYTGGITIPAIAGASALNPIVFNGNGNVINAAAAGHIMAFSGASYITLNNFQLINPNAGDNKYGIHVSGGSQYLTFSNNVINVGTSSTSSTSGGIIVSGSLTAGTTAGNNGSYLTITNNQFIGGYYGVTLIGNSSYLDCVGHTVTGNTFDDFYMYGIYLGNVDGALIEGNSMNRASRASVSTLYGLYITTSRNVKFRQNIIHNTGAGSYSAYPVYITTSVNLPGFETELVNNLIYNIPTTSTIYGLYLLGTREYINIYHNTVYLNTTGSGTNRNVFFSTAPNMHNMKNNIFGIEGSGTGTKHLIYVSATSTSFYSDNNVLYLGLTTGTNYVGYWGTNHATLMDWQMNNMQDLASVDANPVMAGPALGNLTPLSGAVDNIGAPLGVMIDIYGNPRSANSPDPGSIEFVGISADVALNGGFLVKPFCLNASDTVYMTITNTIGGTIDFSINPLTATWMVNGPVNSNGSIVINSGTLAPATSMQVMGTGVNFSKAGIYTLGGYISPNTSNAFAGNDTLMNMFELTIYSPFEVTPAYSVITNTTDTLVIKSKSTFFPAGGFFMTEICHYKYAPGEPTAGWPSYLLADDYIEITGSPGSDLAGITLEQWDGSAMLSTHTFPTGTILGPNGTAIIAVGQMGSSVPVPASFYYHGNGGYTGTFGSTIVAGRILKDASGNIMDAVGYGNYTFPAAAGVTANDWSGTTPAVSGSGNRLEGPYTKSSANWIQATNTNRQDPNVVNNLVIPPVPPAVSGLSWTYQGFVIDTAVTQITVGPFAVSGTYEFVGTYVTPCGTISDTAVIEVQLLSVYGDATICAGDSTLIGVFLPGTAPWTVVISDGTTQDTLPGIPVTPIGIYVSPSVTTTYTLVSYWDATMVPIPANLSVTITVNQLPTVTLPALTPVCINAAPVTLTGGTPTGGTYAGPGVTAGVFNPATAGVGTHVITYTYTDINTCTNSASTNMVVNALPVVAMATPAPKCVNAAAFALTGGTPAGGTYSGPGVSAGMFNPAVAGVGTHVITYTYTDLNNCTNSATANMVVNALPVVTLALFDTICLQDPPFALTGGTPTGGTYSGTGVTAGMFNPAVAGQGMHVITFTYTDGNGCTASATDSIYVDACTGINTFSSELSIELFPNPAKDELNIEITGISNPVNIRVMNLAGQEMYREQIETASASVRRTLDVSKYPAGLYYVRLESGSVTKVHKVVVLD